MTSSALALEDVVGQLLMRQALTLAVAESCTGGLVGHRLTNVPGSSAYFMGGVIAYSYDAKEHLLGVRHNTLYDYGAVSEPVVHEMARGVRRALGADIGMAVTGIAGPGGGLPGKPVGLTWIAIATHNFDQAKSYIWEGDRETNKSQSAEAVLNLLKDYLVNLQPQTSNL